MSKPTKAEKNKQDVKKNLKLNKSSLIRNDMTSIKSKKRRK